MTKLVLPLPSPVPLTILGMPFINYLAQFRAPGELPRMIRACPPGSGMDLWPTWCFLARPKAKTAEYEWLDKTHIAFLDSILKQENMPELGSLFSALWEAAEQIAIRGGHDVGMASAVLTMITGKASRMEEIMSNTRLMTAFAERGFRPGMPLEELFEYVPPEGEQQSVQTSLEESSGPLTPEERAALLLFFDEHGLLGEARETLDPGLRHKLGIRDG